MPTALISVAPDLVGFPTKLDGSGSVDPAGGALRYAWHFVKQPPGSTVTDADLTQVPTPSFSPDKGGAWTVALTVSNGGGDSATAQMDFSVPTVPLFYRSGTFGASSENIELGVVRSDGTGAHAIACAVSASYDGGPPVGADFQFPTLWGMRVWDPPMPGVSKLVFEEVRGGSEFRLYATDENGDCTAHPPVRLDDSTAHAHQFPRFSPNGARVAYVDSSTPHRVITVAVDGTSRHVVRSTMARDPGTPPVWTSDTHLAWAEDLNATGSSHLVILSADDADNAGDTLATKMLDCDPATAGTLRVINQFDLTPDLIIAGGKQSRLETNQPVEVDLYRFAVPAASCVAATATLLASEPPGGDSWDFALSPDGKTIVLSSSHGQIIGDAGTPPHDLFTVAADGSTPLTRFTGSAANLDDVGPRWLAGGRQLGWTQLGQGGGLAVANANGQAVRNVLPASATTTVAAGSNRGSDCAFGGHDVAAPPLFAALVLLWRRRRR